jgi:hypothetical protein
MAWRTGSAFSRAAARWGRAGRQCWPSPTCPDALSSGTTHSRPCSPSKTSATTWMWRSTFKRKAPDRLLVDRNESLPLPPASISTQNPPPSSPRWGMTHSWRAAILGPGPGGSSGERYTSPRAWSRSILSRRYLVHPLGPFHRRLERGGEENVEATRLYSVDLAGSSHRPGSMRGQCIPCNDKGCDGTDDAQRGGSGSHPQGINCCARRAGARPDCDAHTNRAGA